MNTRKLARRACAGPVSAGLVLAAGLAMAGLMAGCEGESDTAANSVKSTSAKLNTVAGGGPVVSYVGKDGKVQGFSSDEQKLLNDAASGAQTLTSNSRAPMAAAGSLLASQSSMTKGRTAAAVLGDADRRLLNSLTGVRSMLGTYAENMSDAEAARGFDPTQRLAEIEAAKKQKATEVETRRREKAKIDAEIAQFRRVAGEKAGAAKAEFDEAAKLSEQATKLSATAASPLVEQATARSRAGDALRKDGLYQEAQAALAEPRAAEQQLYVDELTAQIAGLDDTAKGLQEKLAKQKKNSDDVRAAALKVAGEIDTGMKAVAEARTGEWTKAFDETLGAYKAALSSAQKATQDSPVQAKLAVGSAQQAIGNLQWRKAQTLGALAATYADLAALTPALPQAADYKAKADELAGEQKSAVEEASAAFEAAKAAFTTVNMRGSPETKERLDKLGEVFDKSGQVAKGEALDLLGEFLIKKQGASGGTPPPSTTPSAANSSVPPEIASVLQKWLDAMRAGDNQAVIALYHVEPAQRATFEAISGLTAKGAKLDQAMVKKFGMSLKDAAKSMPGVGGALGGVGDVKASDFKVTVSGDSATVQSAGDLPDQKMVKVDGKWYLTPGDTLVGPQAAMLVQMVGPMGQALDEVTAQVESGQLASAEAAIAALQAKIMAALGGGTPPGGGG